MADSETTLLLEQDERAVVECREAHGDLKASAVVADVATLGSGTLMAAAVNVAVVFVLPKLLTIEAYGYWRLFSLYAAYAGFLHLGFADGALLRWAGRPFDHFPRVKRSHFVITRAKHDLRTMKAPWSSVCSLKHRDMHIKQSLVKPDVYDLPREKRQIYARLCAG